MYFKYKNLKVYNVVLEEITQEARVILRSMCYGGLCSLNIDDMWNLFKALAWYKWQCESVSESFACSISMCKST